MLKCHTSQSGKLRLNLIVIFGLIFVSFTGLARAACDCGTECSCSQSNCTAGQYWVCSNCVDCPAGHFCLGNSTAPEPCPAGTENPNTGSKNSSDCTACVSGTNSTAGSVACTTPCPAGYNCTLAGNITLCPVGTYSNYGEGICHSCPTGKVCLDPTQQPQYCPGGYEPSLLQSNCSVCEPGTFSYNGTSCQSCANGSYSLGAAAECTV